MPILFFEFGMKGKLKEIEETIQSIKKSKNFDLKIIDRLKFDLDEEEKISRNYLQITQNGMFPQSKKRALFWNKKVIELKDELNKLK
jgi:hypothetical protein